MSKEARLFLFTYKPDNKIIQHICQSLLIFIGQQYGMLVAGVGEDVRKTGRCDVALAKNIFATFPGSWPIRKHFPYFEEFNRAYRLSNFIRQEILTTFFESFLRMLQMQDTGLLFYWQDVYQAKPRHCLDDQNRNMKKNDRHRPPRITFQQLAGTFIALGVGSVIAMLIFITENGTRLFSKASK